MTRGEGACLICGKPLVYYEKAQEMECAICHKKFESYASCEDRHYVCDVCHAAKGLEAIKKGCLDMDSKNPIAILQTLMEDPYIYMHGPEHHVMVGAAILTAYKNSGGDIELWEALSEMQARGEKYPGGSCGFWGACGAAVSCGMAMSIITKATPLTGKSWALCNQTTAKCLEAIAALGGPRCCKRNSFTAARVTAKLIQENLNIRLELPDRIRCTYFTENKQCLKKHCPYNPDYEAGKQE